MERRAADTAAATLLLPAEEMPPDRGTRLPQGIGDLTLVDQLIKRTVSSTTATASAAVGLASRANARNGLVGGSLLV